MLISAIFLMKLTRGFLGISTKFLGGLLVNAISELSR